MGKSRKTYGIVTNYDLSPEGLRKLREKMVKPRRLTTSSEIRDKIHELEGKLSKAEQNIDEANKRLYGGKDNFVESEMDYIEIELNTIRRDNLKEQILQLKQQLSEME